jgi:putative membrane protein
MTSTFISRLAFSVAMLATVNAAHAIPGAAWHGETPSLTPVAVTPAQSEGPRKTTGNADRDFLEDMARAGLAEIEASKLALERSTLPEVKTFAQKMIDDHTKLHSQVKVVADARGITLPDGPSAHQNIRLQRLRASTGVRFDKRYAIDYGVVAHQKAIATARKTLSQSATQPVKDLASRLLPQLEHHLLMGRELQASLQSSATGKATREGPSTNSMPPPGSPPLDKPAAKTH